MCIRDRFSFLFNLPVETIGSRFNGIPQELPNFGLPDLSIHDFGKLISPAITIALLGAIESLLSARVADSQINDRHDPNQELIAQGLSNIAAPLFGGFAAVSYTHLRAHETVLDLVCRLLLEKKKQKTELARALSSQNNNDK